jgi:ATP-dependent Clp endopeptidase proteolytic subunit ClpP
MNLIHIENRVGHVRLNDAVTPQSADDLIGDIERLYGAKAVAENLVVGGFEAKADDALETLELDIHTPGGSILDGYRIHTSLMQMRARGVRVVATVNTLAASMGSVVIMAADEVKIVQGGRIMIHEAQQTISGDAADHERSAKILNEMSDEIAQLYAARTGATKEEMRELMKAETWMGAKEALQRGFVDQIITQQPVKASAEFDKPPASNMSILAKLFPDNDQVAKLEASIEENETLRADLQTAQAQVDEFKALAEVNATLQTELAEATAKLTEFEASATESAEKIEALEKQSEVSAEIVSIKASELLAEQGHPEPLALNEGTDASASKYSEYRALQKTDPRAAAKFWELHESEIKVSQ